MGEPICTRVKEQLSLTFLPWLDLFIIQEKLPSIVLQVVLVIQHQKQEQINKNLLTNFSREQTRWNKLKLSKLKIGLKFLPKLNLRLSFLVVKKEGRKLWKEDRSSLNKTKTYICN